MFKQKFSIIIPSKDRFDLAKEVIIHNLSQSYLDFEMVIVDNGSTSELYDWACSLENPKIKPFRTGGLNMPDNWQFGFDKANGDIILMSEDKIFLHPRCLEYIYRVFDNSSPKFITWCIGVGENSLQTEAEVLPSDFSQMETESIIKMALNCRLDLYQKVAPRSINMAFLRSYAKEIEAKIGRIFIPISPDYSCGCSLLSGVKSYLHTFKIMSYIPHQAPSNGVEVQNDTAKGRKFFKEMGIDKALHVSRMPCKEPLFGNLLLADMLGFWERTILGDMRNQLNWRGYWLMIISEILLLKKLCPDRKHNIETALSEIRTLPLSRRLALLFYAIRRFIDGWPNRKLKMRNNAKEFFLALRLIIICR